MFISFVCHQDWLTRLKGQEIFFILWLILRQKKIDYDEINQFFDQKLQTGILMIYDDIYIMFRFTHRFYWLQDLPKFVWYGSDLYWSDCYHVRKYHSLLVTLVVSQFLLWKDEIKPVFFYFTASPNSAHSTWKLKCILLQFTMRISYLRTSFYVSIACFLDQSSSLTLVIVPKILNIVAINSCQ